MVGIGNNVTLIYVYMTKNRPLDPENIQLGLTYDDVLIVPKLSNIKSRGDVSLKTKLTNSLSLEIPIVAAPMDSVCESKMAIALAELGGLGIVHRFQPAQEQADEIRKIKNAGENFLAGFAVGINNSVEDDMEERAKLCVDAGADILVLDIAHGHSLHALSAIKQIKDGFGSDISIVAGNIATAQAAIDLAEAGADCLRVGVGPGGVCTTREVTGVGVPQLTAIYEIVKAQPGIPIMADGGIRTSGDIAKALAAGADTLMIGSLLAGTDESPGEVEHQSGRGLIKQLRGMASKEAAEKRAQRHGGKLDDEYFEHRSPEGVEGAVPYRGKMAKVIGQLLGGVKSSLSYVGASDLEEFRENVSFMRVTSAGLTEGKPHATF